MTHDIYYHEKYKMWWPKFDHKPDGNHHMIMSGINAIDEVIKHCKNFDVCVQAGGHLGYWPNKLAETFRTVYTFEPDPIVYQCLEKNIKNAFILAHNCALGEDKKTIPMRRGSSAGSTRYELGGKIQIIQIAIDDLNLSQCNAILLDIEGYEINALRGAAETIKQFSPVILVEELAANKAILHEYLQSLNYKQIAAIGKDGIWKRTI